MAHVKMLYGEIACTRYDGPGVCPHGANNCLGYEDECDAVEIVGFYADEHGRKIFDDSCKFAEYRDVYAERDMRRFEAVEQVREGFNFPDDYPYVLVTARREYPCKFLEIDGHVYCDSRKTCIMLQMNGVEIPIGGGLWASESSSTGGS